MPPDTLVPGGDSSLLFTGAGMNQFKDEFYGRGGRSLKRAATCQKCIRTGDIERVGHTASHHTFFEMLGNFSFGDYFKHEAILWAWQFMREQMEVPAENMVVSIYEDDEDAAGIWGDSIGIAGEKIYRYGEGENFWPANVRSEGPDGPCGPCTEIFYDRGPGAGCGSSACEPSCECERFVEVWNLVFQEYDRREGGELEPLPMKNIDTGMGLERMARVMQNVPTNFDIDAFAPLIDRIAEITGQLYRHNTAPAPMIRRIADHARAVFFCIADGVIPSNEERGYVVRRLLRRAVRDGVQLGTEGEFLTELIEPVVAAFGDNYPELKESREHIRTVVGQEEKAFQRTVRRGSAVLSEHIANLKRQKSTLLRGKEVFDLYQTYGFPVEMTESILHEHNMSADVQGFLGELERHQKRSKASSVFDEDVFARGPLSQLQQHHQPTEFTGYRTLESEGEVVGIIAGSELQDSAEEGSKVQLVLDRTPAYGESGGQKGDSGVIESLEGDRWRFIFDAVQREKGFFLHNGRVEEGRVRTGKRAVCRVDKQRRRATARAHSATHLLHYALRKVLGEHAGQSGSSVGPDRLRFDFSNPADLSAGQLRAVEDIVNDRVLADLPVSATRMSRSEAQEIGAMALFGEKYDDVVRVISIGDLSMELCGGTHCERSGEIGLFKIISETSVAGGIRRIEALTGLESLSRLREREDLIDRLCDELGTQQENLPSRVEELQKHIRNTEKELEKAREDAVRRMASGGGLMEEAEEVEGIRAVFKELEGGHKALRSAADVLRKNNTMLVCLLAARQEDGKVALVAAASEDLVERGLSASEIAVAAARVLGGGGGGRDDLAQAGGADPSQLPGAFEAARECIRQSLRPNT